MYAQVEKPKGNKNRAVANSVTQKKKNGLQGVAQRLLKHTNAGFIKNGRLNGFSTNIEKELKSKQGVTSRNHTISYETITNGVKGPINDVLINSLSNAKCQFFLEGLVKSVFPNGATTLLYSTNANLVNEVKEQHKNAGTAIANIISELTNKNLSKVELHANELIKALNNSPDNLRVGNSSTNSSIGGSLDLSSGVSTNINKNEIIYYRDSSGDFKNKTANGGENIILITGMHGDQLRTLFTETYSQEGFYAYSSGAQNQSSNIQGMKKGTMTSSNQTPIGVTYGQGAYMVFEDLS